MSQILLTPGAVVLIVERESIIAASLEMSLGELGATKIHSARDIDLAARFLAREVPTLALVDWQDNNEAYAALLARLKELGSAVILMTGYSRSQNARDFGVGAVILEKPFGDRELEEAVLKALPSRGAAETSI
jgi:DNA-binding NtrC family response regulator